jgi:hypothetical protein
LESKFDIKFVFPVSSFLKNTAVTVDQLAEMLTGSDPNGVRLNGVASGKVAVPDSLSFAKVAEAAMVLLKGSLVQVGPQHASLYSTTIQGHPVAVLLKAKNEDVVTVDLRCGEGTIAVALLKEIVVLFAPPDDL